jgi:hypothetical protein
MLNPNFDEGIVAESPMEQLASETSSTIPLVEKTKPSLNTGPPKPNAKLTTIRE